MVPPISSRYTSIYPGGLDPLDPKTYDPDNLFKKSKEEKVVQQREIDMIEKHIDLGIDGIIDYQTQGLKGYDENEEIGGKYNSGFRSLGLSVGQTLFSDVAKDDKKDLSKMSDVERFNYKKDTTHGFWDWRVSGSIPMGKDTDIEVKDAETGERLYSLAGNNAISAKFSEWAGVGGQLIYGRMNLLKTKMWYVGGGLDYSSQGATATEDGMDQFVNQKNEAQLTPYILGGGKIRFGRWHGLDLQTRTVFAGPKIVSELTTGLRYSVGPTSGSWEAGLSGAYDVASFWSPGYALAYSADVKVKASTAGGGKGYYKFYVGRGVSEGLKTVEIGAEIPFWGGHFALMPRVNFATIDGIKGQETDMVTWQIAAKYYY
ncbi:hypothetical protein ACFL5G_01285 [Candidatus Margulisiibacteriota bacterium]